MRLSQILGLPLLIVVAACSTAPTTATAPPLTIDAASSLATPDGALESEIAGAIRFRSEFGLRSDEAFVRAVFANPAATRAVYNVPMLPAELEELQARVTRAGEIAEVVRTYGQSVPETFGGLYIDPETSTVYGLFVGPLIVPSAAIWRKLQPFAPLELRSVRYSQRQLDALMEAVATGDAWFESIGAPFRGASRETEGNRVLLILGGEPAGGINAVAGHFGVDAAMLRISVDTDQRPFLPRGSLKGQLVDSKGKPWAPGENLIVSIIGDIGAYEPDDSMGIATTYEGSFEAVKLAQMGWTIKVYRHQTGQVVGTAHVQVVGGQTTYVDVEVGP